MMAIFYFLVISPARREKKQHSTMLEGLKRGDEVLTSSGMIGTISDIDAAAQTVTIELSKNVKVRMLKSSVTRKYAEPKKKEEETKAS
jgi:preprotein translocase subunit YajC